MAPAESSLTKGNSLSQFFSCLFTSHWQVVLGTTEKKPINKSWTRRNLSKICWPISCAQMLKRINRYNALQYMLLQSNTHKFRDTYLSCFHQGHCWNVTVSRISWHPRNDCKKDLTLKRSSCLYNLWQMLYLSVTKLFNMLLTCLLYYELFSLVKQGVVFPRTACCMTGPKNDYKINLGY